MPESENIFLIGLMGAGKSTVGKKLALRTGKQFIDADDEIEARTGAAIDLIFELEGEQRFRERESSVLKEVTDLQNIVLATGGGAVLSANNRKYLTKRGTVIYLKATPRQLAKRTAKSQKRPLLKTRNQLGRIKELLEARGPLYEEIADLVVDVEKNSVKQIVDKICQSLQM